LDDGANTGWVSLSGDDGGLTWSEAVSHKEFAILYRSSVLIHTDPALARCTRPARHICPDHAASYTMMGDNSDDAIIDPLTVECANVAMGFKTRAQAMESIAAIMSIPASSSPSSSSSSLHSLSGGFSPHDRDRGDDGGTRAVCCLFPPGAAAGNGAAVVTESPSTAQSQTAAAAATTTTTASSNRIGDIATSSRLAASDSSQPHTNSHDAAAVIAMFLRAATSDRCQFRTTIAPIASANTATVIQHQPGAAGMTAPLLSASSSLPSTHQRITNPSASGSPSSSSAASSSSVLVTQRQRERESQDENENQRQNGSSGVSNDDRMDAANDYRMYDDDHCGDTDGDGLGAIVCGYAETWYDSDADADRILADDVAASPSPPPSASGEAVSPPSSSTHPASAVHPSSQAAIDLCSDSDSDAETGRKGAPQRRSDDGECLKEEKKDGGGESTVDGDAASTSAIPSTSAETTVGRTSSLPHTSFAIDPGEHDTEGKEEEQKKRQKDGDGDAMQIDDAGNNDHPAAYLSVATSSSSSSSLERLTSHKEEHDEKEVNEESENEEEDGDHAAQSSSFRGPPSPYCISCGLNCRSTNASRTHMLRFHTRAIPCLRCDRCFHAYAVRRSHYKEVHQCDVPDEHRDEPRIQYRKVPEVRAILDQYNGDMRAAGLAAAKERAEKEEKDDGGIAHRTQRSTSSTVGLRRKIGKRKDDKDEDEDEDDDCDSEYDGESNSGRRSTSTPQHCIVCGEWHPSAQSMRRHLLPEHFRSYCIPCGHPECGHLLVMESERKLHYKRVHEKAAPPLSKPFPVSGVPFRELPEVKEILDRYGGDMKAAGLAAAAAAAAKKTKTGRDGRKTPTSKTNAATLSHSPSSARSRSKPPDSKSTQSDAHAASRPKRSTAALPPVSSAPSSSMSSSSAAAAAASSISSATTGSVKSMRCHDTRAHAASANETSNAHCKPAFAHPPKRTSVTSILAPSTASTTISSAKHGTSAVTTPNAAAATSATSSSKHPTVPINDHHTQR